MNDSINEEISRRLNELTDSLRNICSTETPSIAVTCLVQLVIEKLKMGNIGKKTCLRIFEEAWDLKK